MNKKTKFSQSLNFIKIISLSFCGIMIGLETSVLAQESTNNQNSYLESAILTEINKARTNPIGYADWLESNLSDQNSAEKTNLNQAINFLRNLPPLPEIKNSEQLKQVATEIAKNNQPNNNYGLINIPIADNIKAQQIIITLFNNNKAKETEIFSTATNTTGIACISSNQKCVMAYPQSAKVAVTDSQTNSNSTTNNTNNTNTQTTKPSTSPIRVAVSNPNNNSKPNSNPSSKPAPNTNNNTETTNKVTETDPPQPVSENQTKPETVQQTVAVTQQYNLLERGSLQEGDLLIPSDGSLYDAIVWNGKKGDSVVISLESSDFDTYLAVQDSTGKIIAENDDFSEGNSNSSLSIVLPKDGTYRFIINSYDPKGRGDYSISVEKK